MARRLDITPLFRLSTEPGESICELSASCLDFYRKHVKTARRKLTIVENVRAGIAAYRAKHGKWGRTPTAQLKKEKILQLKAEGRTVDQIAYELGISRASVYRLLA